MLYRGCILVMMQYYTVLNTHTLTGNCMAYNTVEHRKIESHNHILHGYYDHIAMHTILLKGEGRGYFHCFLWWIYFYHVSLPQYSLFPYCKSSFYYYVATLAYWYNCLVGWFKVGFYDMLQFNTNDINCSCHIKVIEFV